MNIVEKLLGVFQCMGFSKSEMLELFEQWIQREDDITVDLVKEKLQLALGDIDFDWVSLGLNSKFVYNAQDVSYEPFNIDNLLIFTDSFRWKDAVRADAILSSDQRDELKEQFREIGVQYFDNIHELIDHPEFEWLPFEVKHAIKANFEKITYTNEDIIFYLKTLVWEYFYPNSLDPVRLNSIKEKALPLLQDQQKNEGWTEMTEVLDSVKDCFPGVDLYELSRVDWGKDIQYKNHYRNPFTLGFIRLDPNSRSGRLN